MSWARFNKAMKSAPGLRPFTGRPYIEHSSMIAVAEYEEDDNGRMRAMIREILKKDSDTVSYFDVGDEYPVSSYYGSSDKSYGDGLINFFIGSPATMSHSMSYKGDRIKSLGGMPLALFREKCSE